jgi:hypothetical protein
MCTPSIFGHTCVEIGATDEKRAGRNRNEMVEIGVDVEVGGEIDEITS